MFDTLSNADLLYAIEVLSILLQNSPETNELTPKDLMQSMAQEVKLRYTSISEEEYFCKRRN